VYLCDLRYDENNCTMHNSADIALGPSKYSWATRHGKEKMERETTL